MLNEIGIFTVLLFQKLVSLLIPFFLAWAVSAILLVVVFRSVKNRVRERVTALDTALRGYAGRMRYRVADDHTSDRVPLTWFFRFWTNFASAPSLSFWSLAVPFWAWHRALETQPDAGTAFRSIYPWLLPGVCYAGSMLLSFVLKRIFKRVRPPRKDKAFGYKLKDPSFPSGHSLTSFCFWIMLAVVVAGTMSLGAGGAFFFAILGTAIVMLTGWSRVYLGVHFPSDVLGGYTIATTWCFISYLVLNTLRP